jgi:hypothetical protein
LRFVITVYAESSGIEDPQGQLARAVAAALKAFLTGHFAIHGERLHIQGQAGLRAGRAAGRASKGGPRWRVEVTALPIGVAAP